MNPPEPQPARVRPFSPVGWLVATALFLSVAGVYAYLTVFSAPPTPDEGYLMITVQSFIDGHALYDEVFTQYGPFYYAYKWGVHALLSVPLTHDATRMLCMIHWLTAAVVLGAAGGVMTRSILAGLLVFTQAVVHLTALASEPGHPQELVAMLLALGMLLAARETPRFNRLAALAVVAALLVFTKINVGVFFGFALLLVMRLDAQARSVRRWETWILLGVCAALPFMLMRRHLAAEWCRNYSLLMAGAVSAAFLVAANPTGDRTPRPTGYAKIACFFLLPSAICLGVVWLTGTTLNGLIDGLLLTPLKMPGVALLPLPLSNGVVLNAAASLAAALMVRGRAAHPPVRLAVVGLKAAYGIVGALCLVGSAKTQLAWLLPWVWLVLVPTGEKKNGSARDH